MNCMFKVMIVATKKNCNELIWMIIGKRLSFNTSLVAKPLEKFQGLVCLLHSFQINKLIFCKRISHKNHVKGQHKSCI